MRARPTAPIVIFNADDFGLCAPVNEAIVACFPDALSSTSVMVPCRGFQDAASRYRSRSVPMSVGLHFTLTTGTSELLAADYLYGPVGPARATLTDGDSLFWPFGEPLVENADAAEVAAELEAQYNTAVAAGIDITHIDAHMFVGDLPKIGDVMRVFASDMRLPLVLKDRKARDGAARGIPDALPCFDSVYACKGRQQLEEHLRGLAAGLHYVIFHPAVSGPEIEGILPTSWQRRVDDFAICQEGTVARCIANYGLRTMTMVELRDSMRLGRTFW